jgi:hypothetical protein
LAWVSSALVAWHPIAKTSLFCATILGKSLWSIAIVVSKRTHLMWYWWRIVKVSVILSFKHPSSSLIFEFATNTNVRCDFTHKLELFVKPILAAGFDQKRFYRLLA